MVQWEGNNEPVAGIPWLTHNGVYVVSLAAGLVCFGSVNTVSLKYQNMQEVVGIDGKVSKFHHPATQTMQMFLGETLCLVYYWYMLKKFKRQGVDPGKEWMPSEPIQVWKFAIPTFFDLMSTTLMNLGLIFTIASVFQMLRGSLIIVTAVLQITYMKRRLYLHNFIGVTNVVCGVFLVGLSSVLNNNKGQASNPILGAVFVLGAQLFNGTQYIAEEKILKSYGVPPMMSVGWEGAWGLLMTLMAMIVLYFIPGDDAGSAENFLNALTQIGNSSGLAIAIISSIFAIAFFNVFGLTISKKLSASHRATVDSLRTITVWAVMLSLTWEQFHLLQLVGFVILLSGVLFYNEAMDLPPFLRHTKYSKPIAVQEIGSTDSLLAKEDAAA